ncbi:MAG: glycoside hydrolase/phage tail family protein [Hyphomonadaceae bacterium]
MAQLVLSRAGAAAGAHLLPNGLAAFGMKVTGAALGRTLGSLAGSYIDNRFLAPPVDGPRIRDFHLTESREGASIPVVYGRMRVGGQVIWGANFREHRETQGGKGGPRVREYAYTLSFAVALAEGEVARVSRCWANGEPFDLSKATWRFYPGDETQQPDPLIEAVEGAGEAPAYRGLAYVVFEDLPLDDFGARMPQLSFEIIRSASGDPQRLESVVRAVNLIPGSGEFALATDVVRRVLAPGRQVAENQSGSEAVADFTASLDQLQSELANVSRVNLIVGWFGDDLRCGVCRVRPGVELAEKETEPLTWSVAGRPRGSGWLISQTDGHANYGGTPADESVRQAIRALKARGLHVTLYPFLFMDVPGANGRPDPYGGAEQAAFPWRGRLTCHPAPGRPDTVDETSAAAEQVEAFFAGPDGYRAFVLHYAQMADEEGADGFLIGSEMIGLTRVRDGSDGYPAVDALRVLANDVRTIVGPGMELSYAADWTEYGAHAPSSGELRFPLDALWADAAISYVGLDWYPPMADWRDGETHLDAGWSGQETDYLRANIAGGEGFDWYYADDAARLAQVRTPITDGSYSEPWIYRQKDIRSWWGQAHHERFAGVRAPTSTAWSPGMKPVRFVEFGCPAVDKGANQPNVFYDPKSSESALPHFSNGTRNDLVQRRAVETFCRYWSGETFNPLSGAYPGRMLPEDGVAVWAWDTRPFPHFPARSEVWRDAANWRLGHWLNGRTGIALLSDVVGDLVERAGLAADVGGRSGLVPGYRFDGPISVREALEPLSSVFGLDACETPGGLRIAEEAGAISIDAGMLVEQDGGETVVRRRSRLESSDPLVRLSFINLDEDHAPGVVQTGVETGREVLDIAAPIALDRDEAQRIAERLAAALAAKRDAVSFSVSGTGLALEPGDRVALDGVAYRVTGGSLRGSLDVEAERVAEGTGVLLATPKPSAGATASIAVVPDVVIVDAPPLPGAEDDLRPLAFVWSEPWTGPISLSAGTDATLQTTRGVVERPCLMGRLSGDLYPSATDRWIDAEIYVQIAGGAPVSQSDLAVLNGANAMLIECNDGWELAQFAGAEFLGGGTFRLTRVLRGRQGSESEMQSGAVAGARVLFLTGAERRLDVDDWERGLTLQWRAWREQPEEPTAWEAAFESVPVASRMWSPAHLKAVGVPEGVQLSWTRRARKGGDAWLPGEPPMEIAEAYRVRILAEGELVREWTVAQPEAVYLAGWAVADAPAVGSLTAQIAQLGADGLPGAAANVSFATPTD